MRGQYNHISYLYQNIGELLKKLGAEIALNVPELPDRQLNSVTTTDIVR